MAQDINFLPELTEAERKKGAYQRRINFVAITSLLIIGAILIGMFGYLAFLANTSQRLKDQTAQAENTIVSQSRKEATRRALVEKLETAKQLVTTTAAYSTGFQKLVGFFRSSKSSLKEAEFKNKGLMTITVEFKKSSSLDKLATNLISSGVSDMFGNVLLISLTREEPEPDAKGAPNFVFQFGVNYLKKGLPDTTFSNELNQ
jgi:hypothetical protein